MIIDLVQVVDIVGLSATLIEVVVSDVWWIISSLPCAALPLGMTHPWILEPEPPLGL